MSDFSDKWERDGQWLMGRSLIRGIIDFLRDRHLEVVRDETDHCRVNISLPLPTVRDEISGDQVSVYWVVPEELRPIFEQATGDTIRSFEGEIARLQYGLGQANTDFTLANMNAELSVIEQSKRAQGFGMLWQRAAISFGMADEHIGLHVGDTVSIEDATMTEPSVEEIVAKWESAPWDEEQREELALIVADWRKRGEALEAIRAKIETSKREAAETLEAEGSKYWAGWVDSCTEILDAIAALTPQRQPPEAP